MEQLVLGLFQEQLSKIIVGFRKEQVNANLLNGKGEITDVSLNCAALNGAVSRIAPMIEFSEIHVSRLGFHVTSWSNLRKAPILVDMGCIRVSIQEPLHCVDDRQRKKLRMITEKELVQLLLVGLYKPLRGSGSYGFVDRIADNLTIEIEKIQISFQTCGKFKTLRIGPWTPPQLQLEWSNVKVVSVDEHGNEGDPEQVWAHNRHERQNYLLYKKITMETALKVFSNGSDQTSAVLLQAMPLAVQTAVKRRLRDGAILAVQADVTIPKIEAEIQAEWIPLLAHLAAGLHYCFAKDRSFEDPLRPESQSPRKTTASPNKKIVKKMPSRDDTEAEEELEDSDGEDQEEVTEDDNASSSDESLNVAENDSVDEPYMKQGSSHGPKTPTAPYKDRPIILLPNGLVIYENLSITCSVHHISVRGSYSDAQQGFIQLTAKGLIQEFIWPKTNNEFGCYAQASLSFLSVQERSGKQIRHILIGGISHSDHPSLNKPTTKPREIGVDENFPLFERRSIRDDPLELRHSFPSQAIGLKTTVDFPHSERGGHVKVHHEMGLDEFDLIFDADAWCRALRFALNVQGGGFDPRWHSGDWTEELTADMLCHSEALVLDDHIQNTKLILLDDNSLISSDDFNVTARVSNIEIRIPAAVQEDIRSCDVLVELRESTLIVSSALPRTFISGKIGNSINGDESTDKGLIDFPNDPSDIAYALERTEDPSLRQQGLETIRNVSTFRLQLTVRGFQTKIVPVIPFCNGSEPQQLMAPTDSTMIICFEGEPPLPGSNFVKVALFISIQIHKILLNVDFELLAGATSTLLFHFDVVKDTVSRVIELFSSPLSETSELPGQEIGRKLKKNLHGRRVLVRRQMVQSMEAGGMSIVFCLQQAEFGVTIWRQNIPLTSPLRNTTRALDKQVDDRHITILRLFEINFKQLEFGVEFDFQAGTSRRIVLKACIERGSVKACDFEAEVCRILGESATHQDGSTRPTDGESQTCMVDLLSFGVDALPSDLISSYPGPVQHFALRLEEQVKTSRSWSLAADLTSPANINLYVDQFNNSVVLLIEALLLRTSSRRDTEGPVQGIFPEQSVGAFFANASKDIVAPIARLAPNEPVESEDVEATTEAFVERALQVAFRKFLPANLRLILLRLELSNVLVCIPSEGEKSKRLGLLLNKSDVMVRFVPVAKSAPSDVEKVLACKGIAWSDLIKAQGKSFFQSLTSTTSLITINTNEAGTEKEILVEPFDVGMRYEAANFSLSMNNELMVNDIRRIESFVSEIKSLAVRCQRYNAELLLLCSSMSKPIDTQDEPESPKHEMLGIPVVHAAERTKNTKRLLSQVHHELSHFQRDLLELLRKKDREIEQLKLQLFRTEKERFAALAIVSSRVSGWIRMGGLHQTGQRVARKSTMWPFWAVLRKTLLLLYSGPGEAKPVDVIFLPGAKLRELAGGRTRQDVKRGFALIESSGTTRYFMAGSSKEYTLWIREISEVLDRNNPPIPLSREVSLTNNGLEHDLGEGQNADGSGATPDAGENTDETVNSNDDPGDQSRRQRIGLGNRFSATKNKIGSAFQSARFRGKDTSDDSEPLNEEIPGGLSDMPNSGDDLEAEKFSSDNSGNPAEKDAGEGDATGNLRRRIQFGRRQQNSNRVGLGSRIGSAIQNARQNAVERQQQRPLSGLRDKFKGNKQAGDPSRMEEVGEELGSETLLGDMSAQNGNFQWICSVCTYINNSENFPIHQTTCDMCGSERPGEGTRSGQFQAPLDPEQKSDRESQVAVEEDNAKATDNIDDASESEAATPRGRLAGLGAAVSPAKTEAPNNNQNQARLDSEQEGNHESQSVAEEDVAKATDAAAAPSSEVATRRGRFAGLGAVVSSRRTEAQNRNRQGGRFGFLKRGQSGDEDTFFDGGAVTLKNVHAGSHAPVSVEGDNSIVPMKMFKHRWIVSVGYSDENDSPEMKEQVVKPFLLRAYKANQASPDKGIERHFSMGELLHLHAQISSGIESVLPHLSHGSSDEKMGRTILQFETVVVVGRILDGLLDLEGEELVEKTQLYIAELFESFLNSVLACPLPIDTLASISEIIGINSSTIDASSGKDDIDIGGNNSERDRILSTELLGERSGAMLGLLGACETELLRAEKSKHPAMFSAAINRREDFNKMNGRNPDRSWVHEPLVPTSVTDRFQDAMHEALINVMAERDEAHAQLISSNVLHIHELEQEKRKNENLKIEMQAAQEVAKLKLPTVTNLFAKFDAKIEDTRHKQLDAKLRDFETRIKTTTDEEMTSLCEQLSSEISTKTSHALEIVRLKETMKTDKNNHDAEKEALKDELQRVKALLSKEQVERKAASREAKDWQSSYERLAKSIEDNATDPETQAD